MSILPSGSTCYDYGEITDERDMSSQEFGLDQFLDLYPTFGDLLSSTLLDLHFQLTDSTNDDSSCQFADSNSISTVAPAATLLSPSLTESPIIPLIDEEVPQETLEVYRDVEPVNDNLQDKSFSKISKANVATAKVRQASASRRIHEARFMCPFGGCNDSFTRKHNLNNHLKSHCGIAEFTCDVCNKSFTTLPVLKRHTKTCQFRTTAESPTLLPSTSTSSTPNNGHDLNLDGLQEIRPEPCNNNVLQDKFISKISKANVATMKSREASASRRIHEAKFSCPFEGCTDSFTRKHNLTNHLKAHYGIADYTCNTCNKSFTTPSVLKRHIKICQFRSDSGATNTLAQ